MQTFNLKNHDAAEIRLEVDGELWRSVANFENSTPNDKVFIIKTKGDGTTIIAFGDGKHGSSLPTGTKDIKMTIPPNKNFTSVHLQQGQVQVDNDFNENDKGSPRFCCLYRGRVVENTDPKSLMRVQVQVPSVLGDQEVWAMPCTPIGSSEVPAVGQNVWVTFENGDAAHPIWMGTWPNID